MNALRLSMENQDWYHSSEGAFPSSPIASLVPDRSSFYRSFVGTSAVREYFTLLQKHLKYEDMSFSEYFADTNISKVCTKGKARFTWQSTGQAWDEVFVYVLDFDHECKVTNYQVWADTGAAYLASVGQLDGLKATEE
jgi:hypothetical protein